MIGGEGETGLNIFEQIESVCQKFREQCKRRSRPKIGAFLSDTFAPEALPTLFRNLLHIDIEFRRQIGEQPSSSDYLAEYPAFKRVIRQAFFEPTMISLDGTVDAPHRSGSNRISRGQSDSITEYLPSASRLGDYQILGELGRGGFGVVFDAKHVRRGNRVALKTLPTGGHSNLGFLADANRLHRFRREFRMLCEINHPNLVGMQTLEVDGGQWFFTMDLIDGIEFLEYVRPDNQLDEKRLRSSIPQLVNGIMALHGKQILHRDLKPANVLITKNGRVVILDFGLVAELDERMDLTQSACSKPFEGTPLYAAPEQIFGIRGAAGDWYSVGVMLFEALKGERPFQALTSGELFQKKQHEPAPSLVGHPSIPDDLAKLIEGLLVRDPKKRLDALGVAAILSVGLDSSSRESNDGGDTTWMSVEQSDLVGRDTQIATLEKSFQRFAASPTPEMVLVTGRSGEGKTSLIENFLGPLRLQANTLVLAGRCYDRESVPLKAIDCLIDDLLLQLRGWTPEASEKLSPFELACLVHLFPVLRRIDAIAIACENVPLGNDSKQIRSRAFLALKALLRQVAQDRMIVLFIDDLQWGDSDSAELLSELMLSNDALPIFFVGACRIDEFDQSRFLNRWLPNLSNSTSLARENRISVGPLSEAECVRLVIQRMGVDDVLIRSKGSEIYQTTGGNPYFLFQLIDCFDPETGEFSPTPMNEVVKTRLARLPNDAADFLKSIAVAGQAIRIAELREVCGFDMGILLHMCSERLVRLIGDEDLHQQVDTYHDKIRESILDELPESQKKAIHLKLSETIERLEGLDANHLLKTIEEECEFDSQNQIRTYRTFDLAYHHDAAGDPRAFVYLLLAGEEANRAYAHEDALHNFEKAEKCVPPNLKPCVLFRLWFGLANVHLRLKQTRESTHYFKLSIEAAPTDFAKAQAAFGIGYMYICCGALTSASRYLDEALALLKRPRPRTKLMKGIDMISSLIRLLVIPTKWQRTKDPEVRAKATLEWQIGSRLASFNWEISVWEHIQIGLRQAICAIRTGSDQIESVGLGLAGSTFNHMKLTPIARNCLKRSSKVGDGATDFGNLAHRHFFHGTIYWNSSNFVQAANEFKYACDFAELSGEANHVFAKIVFSRVYMQLNTYSDEFPIALNTMESAIEVEDVRGICWGNIAMADASSRHGDLSLAKQHLDECFQSPHLDQWRATRQIALASKGFFFLQASLYDNAIDSLQEAWDSARGNWMFGVDQLFGLNFLIEALIGPDWLDSSLSRDNRRIKSFCRSVRFFAHLTPPIRSHAHRVRGRAAFALGKTKTGIKHFERSVQLAQEAQLGWGMARALLDLAAAKSVAREKNRRKAVKLLEKMESVIPRAERWLLGEHCDEDFVAPEFDFSVDGS